MSQTEARRARPRRRRRPFQFGIAALLVLQFVTSVVLSIWAVFGGAGLAFLAIPGVILAASVTGTALMIFNKKARHFFRDTCPAAIHRIFRWLALLVLAVMCVLILAWAMGH